jgi:glycosyltransferase involved in cell wall biosynthesis
MTQEQLSVNSSSFDTPIISVLMAVYNCEDFVVDAIASLQRQTLSNIEIVVVDDGSTDRTLELLESMAHIDTRIRVLRTAANHGCVSAWNLGLPYCRSPFIAKMDSDDVAVENRLEKQLNYLTANPQIALVGGAVSTIDFQGNPIELIGNSPIPFTESAIRRSLLLGTPCLHPCWLARRDLYVALGGYREIIPGEDYDFLLRAVTAGYNLANIQDIIMKIRIRPGQISSKFALRQRKMQSYVIKLYRERIHDGADSFDQNDARTEAMSGKLAGMLHNQAGRWVGRGFQSKKRWKKVAFLAAAALISPWQARYFIDRIRMRLICRSALNVGA